MAVRVQPMEPVLKAPRSKRLKPKHDEPVSIFAISFNLRRYIMEARMLRKVRQCVQVEPMKPTLKAPIIARLKLEYVNMLSTFGFNFSLRRYRKVNVNHIPEEGLDLVEAGPAATCHVPTGRPATCHTPTGRPATCHAPTGRPATCHTPPLPPPDEGLDLVEARPAIIHVTMDWSLYPTPHRSL
jgi:hypothetical protein